MLRTLLKNRKEVKSQMKSILDSASKNESGVLSEDQEKEFKALSSKLETLNRQIDSLESVNLGDEEDEALEEEAAEEENKVTAKTKLNGAKAVGSTKRIGGGDVKKEFESLEEFMAAAILNPTDSRLEYREYSSEQSMGTGAKGGFAVPKQFGALLKSTNPAEALVRPRAQVIPAGSSPDAEISFPILDVEPDASGNAQVYGGVVINKVAEGGLKPTTDFNLKDVSLKPHEIAAIIPFTDKLLRNWQAGMSWAADLLKQAVIGFEDLQFLKGNGVNGPSGILYEPSTLPVARNLANNVQTVDIKKMLSLFNGDPSKALWLTNRALFAQMLSLVGDGGGATNIVSFDKSTNALSIYGIPVKVHPRMGVTGAKGDFALIDFSDYMIKDGSGPIVEEGFMQGQWERNKRSIKITFNVDGKSSKTKPYKGEDGVAVSKAVVLDIP